MNDAPIPRQPAIPPRDWADLQALEAKINALLPPQYQNCYDTVKPVSMGSAELVFGPDGKVAWDQIWSSFCDLALAGGPPHRGALLAPASAEEALAAAELYQEVVAEISRGIWLVTELPVLPYAEPGWIGVRCQSTVMASWLARAIVVENVWARCRQEFLYLPAGPHFRLAKEIKNVVTAMAKTHHYWAFHMPANLWPNDPSGTKQADSTELFEAALPWETLCEPTAYRRLIEELTLAVGQETGLPTIECDLSGWLGVPCADREMAIWLMRALVVDNVVVRTEDAVLYVPANPAFLEGDKVRRLVALISRAWQLWEIFSRPSAGSGGSTLHIPRGSQ
jgi:sirohydrochlorin cobaltochelatase